MTGPPTFRDRLVELLDAYDGAERGSPDARLAAYVRGCLSARDALELRVARASRRGQDPGRWTAPRVNGSRPAVPVSPLYANDPRPEATLRLGTDRRLRPSRDRAEEAS